MTVEERQKQGWLVYSTTPMTIPTYRALSAWMCLHYSLLAEWAWAFGNIPHLPLPYKLYTHEIAVSCPF